jgi:Ni/Co efflux regulator RcnB
MRKTILTIVVASLFAASTAQTAVAAERHHVRKIDRAPSGEQFRNANNAVTARAQPSSYPNYSAYSEGHMNMVGR